MRKMIYRCVALLLFSGAGTAVFAAYPFLNGRIIVSRDANGGVSTAALRSVKRTGTTPAHDEQSPENRPYPRIEVEGVVRGPTPFAHVAGGCPSGWRAPSQREMMLIRNFYYPLGLNRGRYHSSTTSSYDSGKSWVVECGVEDNRYRHYNNQGGMQAVYQGSKNEENYLICVRDVDY